MGTPTEEAPGCGGLQLAVDVSPCAGLRLQVAARPPFTVDSYLAARRVSCCQLACGACGVCALRLPRLQGRSEEELGGELTRALERCLLPEAGGAGTHGASPAAALITKPWSRCRACHRSLA